MRLPQLVAREPTPAGPVGLSRSPQADGGLAPAPDMAGAVSALRAQPLGRLTEVVRDLQAQLAGTTRQGALEVAAAAGWSLPLLAGTLEVRRIVNTSDRFLVAPIDMFVHARILVQAAIALLRRDEVVVSACLVNEGDDGLGEGYGLVTDRRRICFYLGPWEAMGTQGTERPVFRRPVPPGRVPRASRPPGALRLRGSPAGTWSRTGAWWATPWPKHRCPPTSALYDAFSHAMELTVSAYWARPGPGQLPPGVGGGPPSGPGPRTPAQ